jgi:hypothetical protein
LVKLYNQGLILLKEVFMAYPVEEGKKLPTQVSNQGTTCFEGHEYTCVFDAKKIIGLVFLVAATVAVIFSGILASGVFGGGQIGYIAGGLVVGGMVTYALAAYLLINSEVSEE